MSNFDLATLPDLLARLEGLVPFYYDRDSSTCLVPMILDREAIERERAECLAAIRALMAERNTTIAQAIGLDESVIAGKDGPIILEGGALTTAGVVKRAKDVAVAAEKEACAKVCDAEAAYQAPRLRGYRTIWRDASISESVAIRLAAAIRVRGEPAQPGSTRNA